MTDSNPSSRPGSVAYSWLDCRHDYRPRTIEIRAGGGRNPILHCAGELDASCAEELVAALAGLGWGELDSLLLDLEEVDFIDGYVVSLIVATNRRLEHRGARLEIAAGPATQRLLELTGVATTLTTTGGGRAHRA